MYKKEVIRVLKKAKNELECIIQNHHIEGDHITEKIISEITQILEAENE